MKHFVLLLIILTIGSSLAKAQISISEADYFSQQAAIAGLNTYQTNTTLGLAGIVAAAGPNQVWDFTTFTYGTPYNSGKVDVLPYPSGAPLNSDPDFTSSTHVLKVQSSTPSVFTYEYLKINSNGYWLLGIVQQKHDTIAKLISWVPPRQELAFSLTYGTSWQSYSVHKGAVIPPGTSSSDTVQAIADGYGVLITPPAVHSDAIRVKARLVNVTTRNLITSKQVSYSFGWYTTTGIGANISTDANMVPTGGSYSEPATPSAVKDASRNSDDALHIFLSSNPVSASETKLYYTMQHEGAVSVTILNALGRSVLSSEIPHASVGENLLPINVQNLEAGTYFIRVITPQNVATQKLVVVK